MPANKWMPVYAADILASCADMSPSQFGGYMRMLLYCWESGFLPNDMEACCRIAGGLSPADWQVCRRRLVVLDAGTSEERLSHARLERERERANGLHQKRCEAMEQARKRNPKNGGDQVIDQSSDQAIDQVIDQSSVLKIDTQPQPQPQLPIQENETPDGVSTSGSGKRRRTYRIHWDCENGFRGHTAADITRWRQAYPGVDLSAEMRVAHAWLCDNPSKAGKRNWAAFLNRWFLRKQERGGSAGVAAPQAQAKRRYFRSDAHQSLTDDEYARWQAGQTPLGETLRERTRRAAGPAAE